MNRVITIRLPDDLYEELFKACAMDRVPASDIIREAARRYFAMRRFREIRGRVLPFAESQGLLVEGDVWKRTR